VQTEQSIEMVANAPSDISSTSERLASATATVSGPDVIVSDVDVTVSDVDVTASDVTPDTVESAHVTATIGLVLAVWSNLDIHLGGDGSVKLISLSVINSLSF